MSSFCISNILARVTTILLIGNLSIAAFVPSTLSLSSSSSLFSPLRPHDSQRLPRFATIVGDIDPDHPLLTVIQPQNQPLVKNLQNSNIRAFDIPNNSTLHLKCTGNREIVWAFPQNYEVSSLVISFLFLEAKSRRINRMSHRLPMWSLLQFFSFVGCNFLLTTRRAPYLPVSDSPFHLLFLFFFLISFGVCASGLLFSLFLPRFPDANTISSTARGIQD